MKRKAAIIDIRKKNRMKGTEGGHFEVKYGGEPVVVFVISQNSVAIGWVPKNDSMFQWRYRGRHAHHHRGDGKF